MTVLATQDDCAWTVQMRLSGESSMLAARSMERAELVPGFASGEMAGRRTPLLALSLGCMITYPGWAYLRGWVEEDSVYQCEGRGREDHVLCEHRRWTRLGRVQDTPRRP